MKAKLALCPKDEDHRIHPKRMFYMAKDGLFIWCKKHQWIKFEFIKNDKIIDFRDVKVIALEAKETNFEDEPLEILAYGKFNAKRKKL